ncbi:Protein involved in stability of MscS mechanosensitive channel [Salmonella bongori]|nr:Protein involved in stability of MscS mechanosensitive channel [Salmonella bongori]
MNWERHPLILWYVSGVKAAICKTSTGDVLERIKREFDAAGISFPYPQMDVNFKRVKDNATE